MSSKMDAATILDALERLSELLKARNATGEICLLGGTAMVLCFKARPSTKDVDAVFEPARLIREMACLVGEDMQLPENWLNDAAKGFLSTRHETAIHDLPQFENLRVVAPTAEYLLAMKCMASRIVSGGDESGDVADIRVLLRHLALKSPEEALAILGRYYPDCAVPPRARYLLEAIFETLGGPHETT